MKNQPKKMQIFSPDGITIEGGKPFYSNPKEAWDSYMIWKEQYKRQGYYSSVNYGRIPYADIDNYCLFSIVE